jgi:hypothetical protein
MADATNQNGNSRPGATESPETPQDRSGEEADPSKRRYVQIPDEKRKQLLEMLHHSNLTIKTIAEQLDINYSTAKHIVKLYKLENRAHALPRRSKGGSKGPDSRCVNASRRTTRADELLAESLRPFYDVLEATRFLKPEPARPPPLPGLALIARPNTNPIPIPIPLPSTSSSPTSIHDRPARSEPTAISPTTPMLPAVSTFTGSKHLQTSNSVGREEFRPAEPTFHFNFLTYKTMIQER